jgi:hypothetical protein
VFLVENDCSFSSSSYSKEKRKKKKRTVKETPGISLFGILFPRVVSFERENSKKSKPGSTTLPPVNLSIVWQRFFTKRRLQVRK